MTFATIKPTRGNRVHRVNLLSLQEHPEQTLQKENIKRLKYPHGFPDNIAQDK